MGVITQLLGTMDIQVVWIFPAWSHIWEQLGSLKVMNYRCKNMFSYIPDTMKSRWECRRALLGKIVARNLQNSQINRCPWEAFWHSLEESKETQPHDDFSYKSRESHPLHPESLTQGPFSFSRLWSSGEPC